MNITFAKSWHVSLVVLTFFHEKLTKKGFSWMRPIFSPTFYKMKFPTLKLWACLLNPGYSWVVRKKLCKSWQNCETKHICSECTKDKKTIKGDTPVRSRDSWRQHILTFSFLKFIKIQSVVYQNKEKLILSKWIAYVRVQKCSECE